MTWTGLSDLVDAPTLVVHQQRPLIKKKMCSELELSRITLETISFTLVSRLFVEIIVYQGKIQALTITIVTYVQFKTVSEISVILARSGSPSVHLIITSPRPRSLSTRLQKDTHLL